MDELKVQLHSAVSYCPVFCWAAATLAELINYSYQLSSIWFFSYYLLILGNIMALFAMLTGMRTVTHTDKKSTYKNIGIHTVYTIFCFVLFCSALGLKFLQDGTNKTSHPIVFLMVTGGVLLVFGLITGVRLADEVYKDL